MEILANTSFVYQTLYDDLNHSRRIYLAVEPDTHVPVDYNQTLHATTANGQNEDGWVDDRQDSRLGHHSISSSSSWWWPLLVVVGGLLPTTTFVGGLVTCLAVAWDRRLHHTLFYFSASLSALQMAMAATVMPSALLVIWQGRYSCSDRQCKLWITADLFFCNGACLNLAFICMDVFLRLKDPLRHGNVAVSAWSLTVWLSAPWSVSVVQSIAQFILSMADANSRDRDGLCFIADRNFVILGTLFSYVIPVFVASIFLVLSKTEVRRLRRRVLCNTGNCGGGSVHVEDALTGEEEARLRGQGKVQVRYTHHQEEGEDEDLAWNPSDSTSVDSDQQEEEEEEETVSAEGSFFKSPKTTKPAKPARLLQGSERSLEDHGGQIYEDDNHSLEITFEESCASLHEDLSSGHRSGTRQGHGRKRIARSCDEQSGRTQQGETRRTLAPRQVLLKGRATPSRPQMLSPTPAADDFQIIPDQALRREISLCQLVQILVLIHAVLWLPFSISNVVYSICRECRHTMTFAQSMTFKWLAYSSAPLGALANCCLSTQIRRSFWSLVVCVVQTFRRRLKTLLE